MSLFTQSKIGTIKVKKKELDTGIYLINPMTGINSGTQLPVNYIEDGSFQANGWRYNKKKKRVYNNVKIINKNRRRKRDRKIDKHETSLNNVYGIQNAYIGRFYTGFIAYSYNYQINRSYIKLKLRDYTQNNVLEKGETYCLSFLVSLAENSKYTIDSIGAVLMFNKHYNKKKWNRYLKKKASEIIIDSNEKNQPVILQQSSINNTEDWGLVKGTFVARGTEKGVIIGNFKENSISKEVQKNTKSTLPVAYYFLDDVRVEKLEEGCRCDENN